MSNLRLRFIFLNAGHFFDHLFVLVFATAALRLTVEWNLSYAELIPWATPGFIAFGLGAIPSGWLADKWSREGMLTVFFIGIGASACLAGLANTPLQMSIALTVTGLFASIYHPVGLALVVQGLERTGIPLAINGIWGNLGVASAALLTGWLVDNAGWQAAFFVPGIASIVCGLAWLVAWRAGRLAPPELPVGSTSGKGGGIDRAQLIRIFAIILVTTAIGGLVFQSTTFALPKVFDERLLELGGSATAVGMWAFVVFAAAAFAQLVVGWMVDRYSARLVLAGVALLQCIFFAIMIQLDGLAALLVAAAFMLVVFGQIPINDVLVGRIAKTEWRSRAYALRYIVTFSVSASAVPIIAWIHGTWGFDRLFLVLSVAALAICLTALALPSRSAAVAAPV